MIGKLFRRTATAAQVKILPADIILTVPGRQTLLQAALDQGLAYPHNCRVGSCGTCKTRLVSGAVKELTDKSYLLTSEEMEANFILACQSVPKGDLVIEVPRFCTGSPVHEIVGTNAQIARIEPLTADIVRLRLSLDRPVTYTAGQYAEIGRGPDARRYSFAQPCPEGGTTSPCFFIRHVPGGAFTDWLFTAAKPGDALSLRAPFGDFWLRASSAPILAVAGGSGLGPVKALLEQARAEKLPRDAIVVFGARTAADLYCLDELASLARGWSCRLDVLPVLSAEPPGSAWTGARGFIHDLLATFPRATLARHHAYLCGPPVMIDAATGVLNDAGIGRENIHADAFTDRSMGQV
jgi:p-cymene methyl-monooxygenase electron transfer component